jgi:hypothetical protein
VDREVEFPSRVGEVEEGGDEEAAGELDGGDMSKQVVLV